MSGARQVMIIPAAGTGSRLGASGPKVLFEVAGRPMIDHLLDLHETFAERFILVLHPSFEAAVRDHCAVRSAPIEYALQAAPTGMLDAILAPHERVVELEPETVAITWCDQIAVRPLTVATMTKMRAADPGAAMILPTVRQRPPYIHLERDREGEIFAVRQRRERDTMPEAGESDVGLFDLSLEAYSELLPRFAASATPGRITGEVNFLPFIPWLRGRGRVKTFPASSEIEAIGVNTPDDARILEDHLAGR